MPVLLMIPGWAHPAPTLARLAPGLRTAFDVRCVALHDLLEKTAAPLRCATLADYRLRLHDMLEASHERPWLLGWSLGGMLALDQAANAPETVAGLVLLGATARFSRDPTQTFGVEPGALRVMRRGLRANPAETLRPFFAQVAAPFVETPDTLDASAATARACGTRALAHGLHCLENTDLRDQLKEISAPVLILHGQEDCIVPWEAAAYLHAAVAGSRLRIYDHAGHDLPLRHAPQVTADLLDFAESVGAANPRAHFPSP